MVELQRQLELKDTTIASLRRVIEQKDELLAATEEKLKALEEKRDEIEEALISLTIDANDNPEEDEIGNVQFLIIFINTRWRCNLKILALDFLTFAPFFTCKIRETLFTSQF